MDRKKLAEAAGLINHGMVWRNTEEGNDYWADVHRRLHIHANANSEIADQDEGSRDEANVDGDNVREGFLFVCKQENYPAVVRRANEAGLICDPIEAESDEFGDLYVAGWYRRM